MSSQDSSADEGMHLGSSFGATEYHGITTYQWASLLMLVIIIVWLNLRYRKKSRIASDAKKGILPPLAPQQHSDTGTRIFESRNAGSSGTNNMNAACSCSRSMSTGAGDSPRFITPTAKQCNGTGPDIGPGPWIAHAMIKNTTTKRTKAKGNCWDNKLCGKPINSSSDEEELKHQLVTIFQRSTSGVPLRRRSPPKLEEIGQDRFPATGGSRRSHA